MSGAGFHNPLHNQLHSPRHMCCGDVIIKVIWFYKKLNRLLFWRVSVNTFIFLCVYDMRIVLLKWNGQTIIKWLSEQFWRCFSCVCPHWDVTRASVCVCVQLHSMSQHSSATANRNRSILMLHRHFLSACYLSGLSFSGEHEQYDREKYWTEQSRGAVMCVSSLFKKLAGRGGHHRVIRYAHWSIDQWFCQWNGNLRATRGSVTCCLQTCLCINRPNLQHNRPMPINQINFCCVDSVVHS